MIVYWIAVSEVLQTLSLSGFRGEALSSLYVLACDDVHQGGGGRSASDVRPFRESHLSRQRREGGWHHGGGFHAVLALARQVQGVQSQHPARIRAPLVHLTGIRIDSQGCVNSVL